MAKLIIHPNMSPEEIENRRRDEILQLTPHQRILRMIDMMEMAIAMKGCPLKLPQGKGVILKKKIRP